MKKVLLFCLLLMCLQQAQAQQQTTGLSYDTDTSSFDYISAKKLNEELANADSALHPRIIKLHGRWDWFWRTRASKDSAGSGVFAPVMKAIDHTMRQPPFCPTNIYRGNWKYLGPLWDNFGAASDQNGRVISLWASPTDPDYLLAGSFSGGLWKTRNGGRNWENITDGIAGNSQIPGTMGITDIAVHPDYQNTIFLSTGIYSGAVNYGMGVVYSYDGGVNWQIDYDYRYAVGTNTTWGFEKGAHLDKLAFSPYSKRLYAIVGKRILMKATPSASNWQDITPTFSPAFNNADCKFADFEFTQAPDGTPEGEILFCTAGPGTTQYLLTYKESNHDWNIAPVNFTGSTHGHVFDVSLSVQNKIYWNVWSFVGNNGIQRIYRSDRYGGNMELRSTYTDKTKRNIVASRTHPDLLYLSNGSGGNPSVERSTDGGLSFPDGVCYTHADGMCLMMYEEGSTPDGKEDVLFAGTDGGVARKNAGENFHSISGAGLNIERFYKHSSNPVNSGMLTAGAHDNGIHAYYDRSPTPWSIPQGGDGLNSAFGQNGQSWSYTHLNNSVAGDRMGPVIQFNQSSGGQPANVDNLGSPGEPPNWALDVRWWIPMKVDQQNILRVGKFFVYKYGPNGSGQNVWSPNFALPGINHGEPKTTIDNTAADAAEIKAHKKTVDFIISERQPNIGYIAYEDIVANPNDLLIEKKGNVFRSVNISHPTNQSWKNVSPPVYDLMVTDLEIDPVHPNRIWACYGGVISSEITASAENRKHRVYYSDNYGDSWTNVSKGLPMVPVNKICYVEGTDDLIFAGTDLGVYRWNKGLQIWQCYSEGIPKCIISEVEMNYCSGKLRVSTFGRGIWETDIAADMGAYAPGYTETISLNTTWGSTRTVNGSVLVKAGATLTINNGNSNNPTTIYMPYKGKITVEPGARLVVDGATITNDCGPGNLWYGIEVAGNNRRLANSNYQGVLELRNGALLQHARVAISNFDMPGYKCGGLIYASNSSINNCVKAVSLNNTRALFYNSDGTVTCSFNNVNFIKDDPAYPIDQVGYFSSWNMEKGVELIDCKFNYAVSASDLPSGQRYWGASIQSTGAKVEGCTFEGFDRGIYATDYNGSGRPIDIKESAFYRNNISIILTGNTYGNVSTNNIDQMVMPPNNFFNPKAVGIYLDRTQGAFIGCDNSITSDKTGVQTIGILANNTKWYGTKIARNNLFNLNRGFQSQGYNDAIALRCNTFQDNKYGMAINPQTLLGGQGSFNNQGTGCNQAYHIQANNFFHNNAKDITSYQVPTWNYYAGGNWGQMPSSWTGSVNVVPLCASAIVFDPCRSCGVDKAGTGGRPLSDLIKEFRDMERYDDAGNYNEAAIELYQIIVRRHHQENEVTGLITFLKEESDNKNVMSQKLLIPLYIDQDQYAMAKEVIYKMDLPEKERDAYVNYYDLINEFNSKDRQPASLTDKELDMLKVIAGSEWDISRFAMALLEAGEKYQWEHPIDDIPEEKEKMSGKVTLPDGSILQDAQPNPVHGDVLIGCFIADDDSYKEPLLVIRNIAGALVHKETLAKGMNTIQITTGKWQPGIYLYSLEVAGKIRDTKKLSVVR